MLKGYVKPPVSTVVDPNKSVAAAIIEAGRRTDESNKALIQAVKSIMMAAPQVVHHETKTDVAVAVPRPTKWTFKVERDQDGLMTQIIAKAG